MVLTGQSPHTPVFFQTQPKPCENYSIHSIYKCQSLIYNEHCQHSGEKLIAMKELTTRLKQTIIKTVNSRNGFSHGRRLGENPRLLWEKNVCALLLPVSDQSGHWTFNRMTMSKNYTNRSSVVAKKGLEIEKPNGSIISRTECVVPGNRMVSLAEDAKYTNRIQPTFSERRQPRVI